MSTKTVWRFWCLKLPRHLQFLETREPSRESLARAACSYHVVMCAREMHLQVSSCRRTGALSNTCDPIVLKKEVFNFLTFCFTIFISIELCGPISLGQYIYIVNAYVRVWMFTCVYVCLRTCVRICECAYIYLQVCIYYQYRRTMVHPLLSK